MAKKQASRATFVVMVGDDAFLPSDGGGAKEFRELSDAQAAAEEAALEHELDCRVFKLVGEAEVIAPSINWIAR